MQEEIWGREDETESLSNRIVSHRNHNIIVMAGGKKKKSSGNAKKSKSRRNGDGDGNNSTNNKSKKRPIPLEDVLTQAESAMEMSDLDTALQLFSYASGVLRSRVYTPSITASDSPGNSSNNAHDGDRDKVTLSTVLGKMGEINASNGDVEGARSNFLDAIELLDPTGTTGGEKMAVDEGGNNLNVAQSCERIAGLYLYLGQLSSGMEALTSFRTGVSQLERAVCVLQRLSASSAATDGANDIPVAGCDELDLVSLRRFLVETRRQLCAAYCSIAELYLTDLCDEPDAESSCEAVLISALAIDDASSRDDHYAVENSGCIHIGPPPPDALQTMANFRLSQSRVPEALECILKAYDRMKVGCEAMSALVGLANTDSGEMGRDEQLEAKSRELVDVEAASSLPEYHFRCQTAKIMLECASLIRNGESDATETSNQCVESAIQVLGSLLAENDEVIEVWYLLGCAFMASTPSNLESAHHYLENALSMLTKVKEDLEESLGDDENDENELEAIECQIIEVKKKLGTYNDDRDEEMMNE